MSLSGFAAGFAAGWKMVDDFMGDLEKRKEKKAGEEGLATSVAEAGQKFAGNLNSAANAGDGTTPETAIPQDFGAPEEMPPYASTEGMPNTLGVGDDFMARLVNSESGGRWDAQNNVTGAGGLDGHFGRVQFGQARLQEAMAAGAIPQGTTPQQFMASEKLQKAAEQWHFADIDRSIKHNGLDQLIGQQINGVPITMDGMRAVAHLGGSHGLKRFIETAGGYNPADTNGTRLSDYFSRMAGTAPAAKPAQRTQPAVPASAVPDRRAAIDVFEGALEPLEPLQPTFMVNAGGAIPDDQGQTTFTSQAPNAQGSVFLQHETQRPQGQQQARRIEFPQQGQRQAIPTGPSTADRFREMRAGHAQRRADAEAARAAAAAQQPVQNKATYTDDEWDSRMWMYEQQRQGGGRQMQSGGDYGAPNQLQGLMQIHQQHGGLRSDPSGAYIVKPPQRDGWLIQSGPEWEAYKQLPRAPQEMVDTAFSRWRFNTTGANMYGDPGGGVANASHGGNPSLGHGTSTDW